MIVVSIFGFDPAHACREPLAVTDQPAIRDGTRSSIDETGASWMSSSGTAPQDTPSRGTPMMAATATAPEDAGPGYRPTAGTAPAPGTTNATNGVTNATCRSTTTESFQTEPRVHTANGLCPSSHTRTSPTKRPSALSPSRRPLRSLTRTTAPGVGVITTDPGDTSPATQFARSRSSMFTRCGFCSSSSRRTNPVTKSPRSPPYDDAHPADVEIELTHDSVAAAMCLNTEEIGLLTARAGPSRFAP
jgi:large exoprotein involved in heme utilization and adhesion